MRYEAEFEADGELSEDEVVVHNNRCSQQSDAACTSSSFNDESYIEQIPNPISDGFTDEDGYFGTNYPQKSNKNQPDSTYLTKRENISQKKTCFSKNLNNNDDGLEEDNLSLQNHLQKQRNSTKKTPLASVKKPLMGVNISTISQNASKNFNSNDQ